MKKAYFIIISIFVIVFIISSVKKSKLSIKESFWWMIGSLICLILSIFTGVVDWFAKIFGVAYPPSLLFVFCILFLIYMIFRNSKRIAEQQEKIIELAQQIAILKEKGEKNKYK